MGRVVFLCAAALLGGCATTPEPVKFSTDEYGVPMCVVGDEEFVLTPDERRRVANALIAEYIPDYCAIE